MSEKSALPVIVESNTNLIRKPGDIHPSKEKPSKFSSYTSKIPKIIFIILGLVILVELIIAAQSLTSTNVQKKNGKVAATKISDPRISLFVAKKPYKVGDNLNVTIGVTSGTKLLLGSDVVLNFDPEYLEASSSGFSKGPIFTDYPGANIDNTKGVIQLSGISKIEEKGFLGTGVFGKINFKAKKSGKTNILVDYLPNKTNESNLIDSKTGKDILAKVDNLELEIK